MEEFQEIKKQVGKPLSERSVFERLERLRQNAAFLSKGKEKESKEDGIRVRKVVGGSR